jgi:hypothetical protein
MVGIAVCGQVLAVLRHNPYYGTHHNLLLGGSSVAQRVLPIGDQAEGLDLAGRFLNTYPNSQGLTAGVQQRGIRVFHRNFAGAPRPIEASGVDYWVFQANPIQRQLNPERWEKIWEVNQDEKPLWSVAFDGVTYAWIYRAYPHDARDLAIKYPLDVGIGDQIAMLGYELSNDELQSGDPLSVTLFWQSDGRIVPDYHVFVHLLDESGLLAAQRDGVPVAATRPTWTWRDGEVLEDLYTLDTAGLAAGPYSLQVGMYDFGTGDRLPASGSDGADAPSDAVKLRDVVLTLP